MLKVTCSCNQRVIFFSQEQVTFSTHVLDLQEQVNFIIWLHSYKILFLLNVLVLGDYLWNKASLQTSLERNSSNFSYISFLGVNFENLIVKFHVPYVLNMHIKFHSNQILFTIWSTNLFFIYNFRIQKIDIITWNFVSIKDVIRTYNLTVRFSKFTFNTKIYDEFVGFLSKLVWRETLFLFLTSSIPIFKVV